MIYDWGVHLIDQILFMMPDAKIKSVYADIKNVLHEEVDDYFKIILKMDNGVTAHIELSTYILKYQPRWLAAGDKGTMIVEDFGCNGSIYRTGKLLEKLPPQITETEASSNLTVCTCSTRRHRNRAASRDSDRLGRFLPECFGCAEWKS